MKKTLFSASLITALSLSTNMGWGNSVSSLLPKSLSEISRVTQDMRSFSFLLGMERYEDVKAYHVGLSRIFSNYRIPSPTDLLDSIRTHHLFVGFLTQGGALHQSQAGEGSYFIFEEKGHPGHFYIASSRGLRHFTVNTMKIAGIQNGDPSYYPTLNHLLESTFTV